jgi:hypothetical protein
MLASEPNCIATVLVCCNLDSTKNGGGNNDPSNPAMLEMNL